jgi:hypothetical protein
MPVRVAMIPHSTEMAAMYRDGLNFLMTKLEGTSKN